MHPFVKVPIPGTGTVTFRKVNTVCRQQSATENPMERNHDFVYPDPNYFACSGSDQVFKNRFLKFISRFYNILKEKNLQ